jgi:2-dehydro-3-deoxygalactonokinase
VIAIDWGTSTLRAYRLDESGSILDRRAAPRGILAVSPGGFPAALAAELAGWPADPLILMSGMVGSRQGWVEVPYAECPADAASLAAGMRRVEWRGHESTVWIVPGLTCRDASGVPDVMRGEETQILGAEASLPRAGATLCLPGTHSKWARVEAGRIRGFATAMTGELFAVLRRHSILGRLMPAAETTGAQADAAGEGAFERGLRRAGDGGGLLHHLFAVRSAGLFGDVASEALPFYLSGMLIGREIADLAPAGDDPIYLIGAPSLTRLYERALVAAGRRAQILDADCVVAGLFRLASLLPPGGSE